MADKGGLQRVQIIRRADAFNGGHFGILLHHRESEAGVDAPAIDQHGTGTALTVIAAFWCRSGVNVRAARQQRGTVSTFSC